MPVHPDIEGELVACHRGNGHERQPVRGDRRGHDSQGPVAAGHPQRIRAVCHGRLSERWQILTRGQDDSVGEVTLNGMVPSYPQ